MLSKLMFCVEDAVMRKDYGKGWGEKHEICTSLMHQLIMLTQELHWNLWAVSYVCFVGLSLLLTKLGNLPQKKSTWISIIWNLPHKKSTWI